MPKLPEREARYAKADEFAKVINQLLTSWNSEAFSPNRKNKKL